MNSSKPLENFNNFADDAAKSVDQAKKSTSGVTDDVLNTLSDTVQNIRQQAAPLLNRVTEQASALAQHGAETVRNTSQQLREKALQASDNTVKYVKEEPVKSILIATAAGAALMALMRMRSRSRDRG